MKTLAAKSEQFLTDAKGKRTGVVLDLQTYEHLREAEQELADIRAYDALRDRAQAEVAAGRCNTLTTYRASRSRKAK
jgi:PHD/YefM family antitoxin component YafN of YafNO toxin-antitoxin module